MTLVEIVQLAQIAAPVGAAVAAVASWRSANASLRTAGRADETSRRAVEALGRATMPVLRVEIGQYPATESEAGRGPVPVTVFIVNHGSNRGLLIGAKITRPDGVALTAVEPMPMEIGSTAVEYEQHGALHLHMGTMPRLLPNAQQDADSAPLITLTSSSPTSGASRRGVTAVGGSKGCVSTTMLWRPTLTSATGNPRSNLW